MANTVNDAGGNMGVPHDPTHAGACSQHEGRSCLCNICGTTWPCPIRQSQRKVLKEAVAYLKSDLYERATNLPDDPPSGMRWTSPIGWSVFLAYGVEAPWAVMHDPDGEVVANTVDLTVGWLQEVLA